MKNNKRSFNFFKKRIKLIAILLIAMFFPVFALSGCTGQAEIVFETVATNLGVMDFYNAKLRIKHKEFISYVNETYEDNLNDLSIQEQNEYDSLISLIQSLYNKIYIVFPALDFHLSYDPDNPNEKEAYNLTDEELGIGFFEIIRKQSIGTNKTYYTELSGSDENTYLPAIKVSGNKTLQDSADDKIKTWGNHLNFEIAEYTQMDKIVVKTEFFYPNNLEEINTEEIKIKREDDSKKIIIVYKESGITYSKIVDFISNTEKKVTKYIGDYTEDNAALDGTYKYVYEEEVLPYGSVTGTYEIKFLPEMGYINVRYIKNSKQPGNYYIFESYALTRNNIITRVHKVVAGSKTEIYDFLTMGGISGKLKKHQVAEVMRIEDLSKINTNEFGIITNIEKAKTDYKKISFVIDENVINCESVGYSS